jgi:hypothetical protein
MMTVLEILCAYNSNDGDARGDRIEDKVDRGSNSDDNDGGEDKTVHSNMKNVIDDSYIFTEEELLSDSEQVNDDNENAGQSRDFSEDFTYDSC